MNTPIKEIYEAICNIRDNAVYTDDGRTLKVNAVCLSNLEFYVRGVADTMGALPKEKTENPF